MQYNQPREVLSSGKTHKFRIFRTRGNICSRTVIDGSLTSWQCKATKAGFWFLICWQTCANHWGMRFCGSSKMEPTLAVMSKIGMLMLSEVFKSRLFGLLMVPPPPPSSKLMISGDSGPTLEQFLSVVDIFASQNFLRRWSKICLTSNIVNQISTEYLIWDP